MNVMDKIIRPRRIKPLDIEVYKEGICFICKEKCEGYAHHSCCVAYCRHKELEQEKENNYSQRTDEGI